MSWPHSSEMRGAGSVRVRTRYTSLTAQVSPAPLRRIDAGALWRPARGFAAAAVGRPMIIGPEPAAEGAPSPASIKGVTISGGGIKPYMIASYRGVETADDSLSEKMQHNDSAAAWAGQTDQRRGYSGMLSGDRARCKALPTTVARAVHSTENDS